MRPLILKFIIASCFVLGFSDVSFSQEMNKEWIMKVGGKGANRGTSLVCDNIGNIYISGYFQGSIYANIDTVQSTGILDIFVVKISSAGEIVWIKNIPGTGDDYGLSIDIMQNNALYISGIFKDSMVFGNDTLISRGDRDIFLAKLDLDGNIAWGKQFGGSGMDVSMKIAIFNEDIFATGGFRDTAYFDNHTLISVGNEDIFMMKFNSDGDISWIKQAGSDQYEYGQTVVTDHVGNVYFAAYFRDTCYFPTDTLISRGSSDLSLSKI